MQISQVAVVFVVLWLTGCAHHQPHSSAQIIMEGDNNPTIRDDVQHAGERVREAPR